MKTAAGIRAEIRRLESEKKWPSRDKEQIAALWIRLQDLYDAGDQEACLSDGEAAEAAKYCKTAAFSAIYGTASLEYVALFTDYARRFHRPGGDPFLQIDTLRAEAIAGQMLGRDTRPHFRRALTLLRRPAQPFREDSKKKDKIASVLRWLATACHERGRKERALRLIRIAECILTPKPGKKGRGRPSTPAAPLRATRIIHARLLAETGRIEEARAYIAARIDSGETSPRLCLGIAGILMSLGLVPEARPFLDRAAAYYLREEHRHYGETLRLLALQFEEALRSDRIGELEEIYAQALTALRLRRSNFIFAENLEAFLEDRTDIYQKMLEWHLSRGMFSRAEQVILDSYWDTPEYDGSAPDRDSAIKTSALSRQSWLENRLRCIREERAPGLGGDFDRIYFHVVPDGIHRLSRIDGREQWEKIPWDHTSLVGDCGGLLTLTTDPGSLPGLFAGTVAYFRDKLFNGLENALDSDRTVCVTAGGVLAGLPWPLFSDRARLVVLPGALPAPERPVRRDFLSLTEDGTTLPLARLEHDRLNELRPDGRHLVPPGKDDGGKAKKEALELLQKAGFFHFAGHGYNHPAYPEQSGLLLRGTPLDRNRENILTFQEIRRLDLSGLRFAFLNSCSSGRGKHYIGGIQINTAAAFLAAGAERLIVSCNPVMDSHSGDFTHAFYSLWNSMPDASPEEIFFRAHRENPEIAAPYLILYGSPP